MKGLHMISYLLVVIGGLNWLIYGIGQTDLGTWIGGMDTPVARVIYILVGVATIIELISHKSDCKKCCGVNAPMNTTV